MCYGLMQEVDNSMVEEVPLSNHGNDDDGVIEPRPGMSFQTEHELLDFYKKYGKQIGFGVMTQRSKREDDGSVRYLTLGCARIGKARNRTSNVSKPRSTTKTDCKAKINAILLDGVLRITIVEAGGYDNLPFVEKDARNYIDKARHLRLGKGGVDALHGYFERMQYKNDGFYSLMDLDDDGRLKNVFWADACNRAAYGYFGDVVTIDTTYLINRYGMPFTPFVGVNHHGQSILFGACLISSEDTDTFVWLFETWLKCMDGRAPNAIIIDQDRAMKNAIAIVFPKTRHRYCLWHIMQKLLEKLGSHSKYNYGLKIALHKCVYDCQTSEEFEKSWEVFLDTYNLHENAWLQSLYSERMHWVPVYLKDTFWAGMSTTQRSESINAFFDGFVHSGTTLKEFVDQFDNALRKRGENEMAADFHSFNCTIPCITHLPMEKQFQELYTNSKFKKV
ncbi:protein FAR1-RELATED SEQUENCE 5-like [Juglans microcarpa x Juglans regia]|uniref:protein FAR1-RELATED SEQUENCE 5-like n=1 Tax=Juglans microcarpa x Juglans regia TaxID=2249226 RepID=UPI001B7F36FC|nr:protein FAR1-RELATED SEQUENCE 5-like [Juglans microcarpa x Juglans regia]